MKRFSIIFTLLVLPLVSMAQHSLVIDTDSITMRQYQEAQIRAAKITFEDLTENSFQSWEMLSAAYGQSHSSPMIDSIYQRVFYHLYDTTSSTRYIVLPDRVSVEYFDTVVVRHYDNDNDWFDYANSFFTLKESDHAEWRLLARGEYVPHIVSAKPILYDLDTIHTQLSQIIGGIGNGWFSAVNEMRVNKLRKYIPAVYGHWGGYWHFVTMPKIFKVQIYHNGAIVSFRNSWSGGGALFLPSDSNEFIGVSWWME